MVHGDARDLPGRPPRVVRPQGGHGRGGCRRSGPDSSIRGGATQAMARNRLKGLMKIAKAEFVSRDTQFETVKLGFENVDEFVANFLLNPTFQSFLKSVETPAKQRGLMSPKAPSAARLVAACSIGWVGTVWSSQTTTATRPSLTTAFGSSVRENQCSSRLRITML